MGGGGGDDFGTVCGEQDVALEGWGCRCTGGGGGSGSPPYGGFRCCFF